MNLQEFQELGRRDEGAQHRWAVGRNTILMAFWKCGRCGRNLPKKGIIWQRRLKSFLLNNRLQDNPTSSGYYCDPCADDRENGIDY